MGQRSASSLQPMQAEETVHIGTQCKARLHLHCLSSHNSIPSPELTA